MFDTLGNLLIFLFKSYLYLTHQQLFRQRLESYHYSKVDRQLRLQDVTVPGPEIVWKIISHKTETRQTRFNVLRCWLTMLGCAVAVILSHGCRLVYTEHCTKPGASPKNSER